MKQEGYVNKSGQPIVHKQIDPKKAGIVAGIILLVVLIIIFIVITVNKSNKNKACNKIEDAYADAAMGYAKEKGILPTVETEQVTIDGDELLEKGRVSKSDIMLKENQCKAKITIIKHKLKEKDEYIKNVTLTNCGYCTTDERYGKYKETSKFPKGNVLVELIPTFNYYETKEYRSKWTMYYEQSFISDKKDEKYGIPLLKNERSMPSIPDVAHIKTIEKDDKNYYRYRDKKWKFYKNPSANYSGYSSVQPSGYAQKDTGSSRKTDWSKWSLNYPDTATYRSIKTATGYRWYYKKDGKKIYWNSGEYYPEQPAEQYTEKDKKATMYSYQDRQWRWYNGERRGYSSYSSENPKYFPYKDTENVMISNWSAWSEESKKNNANSYYREEEIKVKSRYRIVYEIYSLPKLNNHVTKDEFVKTVGKPFIEFYNTNNIKVEVNYKYKYRKA